MTQTSILWLKQMLGKKDPEDASKDEVACSCCRNKPRVFEIHSERSAPDRVHFHGVMTTTISPRLRISPVVRGLDTLLTTLIQLPIQHYVASCG